MTGGRGGWWWWWWWPTTVDGCMCNPRWAARCIDQLKYAHRKRLVKCRRRVLWQLFVSKYNTLPVCDAMPAASSGQSLTPEATPQYWAARRHGACPGAVGKYRYSLRVPSTLSTNKPAGTYLSAELQNCKLNVAAERHGPCTSHELVRSLYRLHTDTQKRCD